MADTTVQRKRHRDLKMDIIRALMEFMKSQAKPNYTQYQLAVSEVNENDPDVAASYREIRHEMEEKYKLPSLDHIVN